jgi:hypothetical protein
MGRASFWATFSQTHLVALAVVDILVLYIRQLWGQVSCCSRVQPGFLFVYLLSNAFPHKTKKFFPPLQIAVHFLFGN